MPSIKVLKTKFDELVVNSTNIALYERLLTLDISDYKPLMEEILLGRLGIEDTREVFKNNMLLAAFGGEVVNDPRISTNMAETMKANLLERMKGSGDNLIKENLVFPSTEDLKDQIADRYFKEYGIKLPPEDIVKLLPIIENELISELSLNNNAGTRDKADQLIYSDQLAFKPSAEL